MKKREDGRYVKSKNINGKRVFFYSSEPTERKALKDIERQMLEYAEREEKGKTFKEVAEEWEKIHFKTLTNNSLKAYKPALTMAIEEFGSLSIKSITNVDIFSYSQRLVARNLAQKTIKNKLLCVSLILKYALSQRYITTIPYESFSLPKNLKKKKRTAASESDFQKIKGNANGDVGFLALLLACTGLRRGEAFALTPSDIDIKKHLVHVDKTVEWLGQHPRIKDNPKTEAGVRDVPFPDILIDGFKQRLSNSYIFQNDGGTLWTNSQVTRRWDKYIKSIELSITPHQLRHYYCTQLFESGIDVKTAQRWLGHSDIKTTLDIYTHLSEEHINDSKEKIRRYYQSK